jgi:hypothetical protein
MGGTADTANPDPGAERASHAARRGFHKCGSGWFARDGAFREALKTLRY